MVSNGKMPFFMENDMESKKERWAQSIDPVGNDFKGKELAHA